MIQADKQCEETSLSFAPTADCRLPNIHLPLLIFIISKETRSSNINPYSNPLALDLSLPFL
jgi:hypothetical protein